MLHTDVSRHIISSDEAFLIYNICLQIRIDDSETKATVHAAPVDWQSITQRQGRNHPNGDSI